MKVKTLDGQSHRSHVRVTSMGPKALQAQAYTVGRQQYMPPQVYATYRKAARESKSFFHKMSLSEAVVMKKIGPMHWRKQCAALVALQ